MRLHISYIIEILIKLVPTTPISEILQNCQRLGMVSQKYQHNPADSSLPDYDNAYHFRFETNDSKTSLFEVLEKEGLILQAGFQILYPSSLLFSKSKKHHEQMISQLEENYGEGVPMNAGGTQIINYGDSNNICYISKAKVSGGDIITVRVGNKFYGRSK